jgi:hypothetical protein
MKVFLLSLLFFFFPSDLLLYLRYKRFVASVAKGEKWFQGRAIRLLVPKEKEKHEKNGIKQGQRKRLSSYQFQTFIEPAHGESAGTLVL